MILSCGDALIDFVPVVAADGREALRPMVGGSCLNVAIGVARLAVPTGFVGGVSTDLFGRMIAAHAEASGVDLRYTTRSERQTTLAFVRMAGGETQYAFYDAQTATREWTYRPGAIPFETIEAVHLGSTTLVNEQGAKQTAAMMADARRSAAISFDPNCRPNLVSDKDAYRAGMTAFAQAADIVKMSDVDFDYLYGKAAHAETAASLLTSGCGLVVVTRGAEGATAWHRKAGAVEARAPAIKVVDTIGAGDSFQAALLAALHRLDRLARGKLAEISGDELHRALAFACSCAAVTCMRAGADPPRSGEVAWT